MKEKTIITVIILVALVTPAWSQSIMPTEIGQKVLLVSGKEKINYIQLINTHSRTYKDNISHNEFTINEKNIGVLWKIGCIGIKMEDPFEKIIVKSQSGELFKPVTNFIQTAENSRRYDGSGNVIYDGPSTTFLLIGPNDSEIVQIIFGDSSVTIKMSN